MDQISLICRCCLKEAKNMKNLIQDVFLISKSKQKIPFLAGYSVCTGIREPDISTISNICQQCERKLRNSYEFRELCQSSNRILLERSDTLKEEFKEEVQSDDELQVIYSDTTDSPATTAHQFSQVFVVKDQKPIEKPPVEENIPKKRPTNAEDAEFLVNKMESNYFCLNCNIFLATYNAWHDHQSKLHISSDVGAPITGACLLCKKHVSNLADHIKERHKKFRPNSCKICSKRKYERPDSLRDHLYQHVDAVLSSFECQAKECAQKFPKQLHLRRHIVFDEHTHKDEYRCPHCGLNFKTFLPLHEHFKAIHDKKNVKNIFPCYRCKRIYMFQRFILEHKCGMDGKTKNVYKVCRQKQGETIEKCGRCSKEFSDADALVCHQYSVCLGEPSFMCVTCGAEFDNKNRLAFHKRIHTSSLICDICGHSSVSPGQMTRHKAAHLTERNFKCRQCAATFKTKNALNHHKKLHEKIIKYECFLCTAKYQNFFSIKSHIILKHLKKTCMLKYACDYCEKKFPFRGILQQHIKTHTHEKPMKCNLCNQNFRDNQLLRRHQNFHHNGQYFPCKFCSKRFCSSTRLKEHLFVHRGFFPFSCPHCTKQFTRKYRFDRHLLKLHNVKYEESIHGYNETADMSEIMTERVRPQLNSERVDFIETFIDTSTTDNQIQSGSFELWN